MNLSEKSMIFRFQFCSHYKNETEGPVPLSHYSPVSLVKQLSSILYMYFFTQLLYQMKSVQYHYFLRGH